MTRFLILLVLITGCSQKTEEIQWKTVHEKTEKHQNHLESYTRDNRDANERQVQLMSEMVRLMKEQSGAIQDDPFGEIAETIIEVTPELQGTQPEEPSSVSKPDLYLIKWTAEWCGACKQWDQNERSKIEAAGFEIVEVDADQNAADARKHGVTVYPSFQIASRSSGNVKGNLLTGYWSADLLLPRLSADTEPPTSSQRVESSGGMGSSVVETKWGPQDLSTYSMPGCDCEMCRGIRELQRQYGYPVTPYAPPQTQRKRRFFRTSAKAGQAPTTEEQMLKGLSLLQLTEDDKLVDLGCGDGRVLIEACTTYGCEGIGVEIDETQADLAWENVKSAGMQGKIDIVCMDARDFNPLSNGVTAAYVYLYPDLLAQMQPMLSSIRRVVSPFHPVKNLAGEKRHDDVYLYWRA